KEGTNTLDYSAYTTGVTVNLLGGTATGTGGISHIQNATGGAGNDVLVGDGNANVLQGQGGRDVLIGGGGADKVDGGSGDDIVIGGTTKYDKDGAALAAVAAYWGRTDLSYADRVSGLQAGVSYTDGTGNHTAALTSATVKDDGAADVLTGGG